jgi:CRP-like cAMP-binding protein
MAEPQTHSLVKALRTVPDFHGLDDRTLLRIVGASVNLFWPAGSTIFEKGSPSEGVYIVLSGRVRVFDPDDPGTTADLKAGESFGELSLLLNRTHSKTAKAKKDAELMVVPGSSFRELLEASPDLQEQFRRKVESRAD